MSLYATLAVDPSRLMQACKVVAAEPAGFEYEMVGLDVSLKSGAFVIVAFLGISDRVTVNPL